MDIEKIEKEYNEELMKIKNDSGILDLDNIVEKIDAKQKIINEASLNLHTLKIDNDNIIPKLEELVNIQEELESLKEDKIELEKKRDNIRRTIEHLEIAYNKITDRDICEAVRVSN